MALYLPDFDRTLEFAPHFGRVPIEEQIVYGALTEPQLLISAASPFKNYTGWKALEKYLILIQAGVVKFPLDSRHEGYLHRYIQSRISKIRSFTYVPHENPELIGYSSQEAEKILTQISVPAYAAPRPNDCDEIFRNLVSNDARSFDHQTLAGILYSKKSGWGKQDFLDFITEAAQDKSKLFQRFDTVDHAPRAFIVEDFIKQKMYHRLDELFFLANARAAMATNSEYSTSFDLTLGARLRAFAIGYAPNSPSLHDLFISLKPESLLAIRESPELSRFLRTLKQWSSTSTKHIITKWSQKQSIRDRLSPYASHIMTSVFAVTASELLGLVISRMLGMPFGLPSQIASFIVGLIPQLTVNIKKTDVYKLYEIAAQHPKMKYLHRTCSFSGSQKNRAR